MKKDFSCSGLRKWKYILWLLGDSDSGWTTLL